jgi:hypothetical protein
VTREQLIVLSFIAAAFVAGWVARALTGLAAGKSRKRGEVGSGRPPGLIDERFEDALEESRRGIDRAIRAYHATVIRALTGRDPSSSRKTRIAREVGKALRSDPANESMRHGISHDRGADLTELELDLADWGFTYGVAWALAREDEERETDEAIADEALRVAEAVFRDYMDGAEWTRRLDDRRNGHAHRVDVSG